MSNEKDVIQRLQQKLLELIYDVNKLQSEPTYQVHLNELDSIQKLAKDVLDFVDGTEDNNWIYKLVRNRIQNWISQIEEKTTDENQVELYILFTHMGIIRTDMKRLLEILREE